MVRDLPGDIGFDFGLPPTSSLPGEPNVNDAITPRMIIAGFT
ncbi:MAG: hypothetical protein R2761_17000 [Acidimicrobiales bacterium]